MVWCVAPSLIAKHQGGVGSLGGGDSTKVPGTDPSHKELIGSEFTDISEKPGTPPEIAIKHEIDLLPESVHHLLKGS